MSFTFKNIPTAPYGDELFPKSELKIHDQVTIVSGPNGYGKSTLISMLKESLKKDKAAEFDIHNPNQISKQSFFYNNDYQPNNELGFIHYNIHQNSHANNIQSVAFHHNYDSMALKMSLSEGQNQLMTMSDIFDAATFVARKKSKLKTLVILIDGIDSGLSVDMIQFMMSTLDTKINQILKENSDINLYLIMTTNNYEMVKNRPVLNPKTFETKSYQSYEEYIDDMQNQSCLHN